MTLITTGLLWFDDSKIDLADKVKQAASRYETKHQVKPNICYTSDVESEMKVEGIRVLHLDTIRPNHLWIGVSK